MSTTPSAPSGTSDSGPDTAMARGYRTMDDPLLEVEIVVEVTRREKVRFTTDVSQGFSETGATWEVGRFWRTVNYHVHSASDLGKSEQASLVSLRFVQPCHPEQMSGEHEYERIPGSDQASQCKRCGRVSGK